MNKRQIEILKNLHSKKEFTTFAHLAEKFNVSVKTVRNDIGAIRDFLDGESLNTAGADFGSGLIETKTHLGVRLNISEEEWQKISLQNDGNDEKDAVFFIIRHLMKNKSLTAQRLAEQYYLSRTQLEKVISKVSKWFFEKHIPFERRRGKGISIRCSEFNYRMALLAHCRENTAFYSELANVGGSEVFVVGYEDYRAICGALDGLEPKKASEALKNTEEQFGLTLNYASGFDLLFLISLCIMRTGENIEVPTSEKRITDGGSDALFADELIKRLESAYNIILPQNEKKFIEFAAEISEIREFDDVSARRNFEAMNIELCRFTMRAVTLIGEVTGAALRDDKFFVKQMFLQLKVTIARLKYGIVFKNGLLSQIKLNYPNMMAIAWFLGNIFEKELELELNENEAGFLALHIGGAIERQLSSVTACIVCDYGVGISQVLKEKIMRRIPEIKITSVFSGRDIHKIKSEMCDFIISATSLDGYRLNRDIINVGNLLSASDIERLEEQVKTVRTKRRGLSKQLKPKTSLFNTELIFPKCDFSKKEELLHMMCARLENLGYVTQGFEKTVLEREKSTPTDIGNGFALPHGLGNFVNHSAAAFATLKEPIEWTKNGDTADIVFLAAFDMDESGEIKEEIVRFYKSLVSFMEQDGNCDRLRNITDTNEIIKIFDQW